MRTCWSAWRCRIALTAPLSLKRGALNEREVILLRYQHLSGGYSWAEASPLPGWSVESVDDVATACKRLVTVAKPEQALALPRLPASLSSALGLLQLDILKSKDLQIESNFLLLAFDRTIPSSTNTIKLKVGRQPVVQEVEQINTLCEKLLPHQMLRLDANQTWRMKEAEQLLTQLSQPEKIDYIEEPLLASLDYSKWASMTDIGFAYDERLTLSPPVLYRGLKALVIKPTLLGWQVTGNLKKWADDNACQSVLSSSFESPLGLKMLKNLAEVWELKHVQGLATEHLIDSSLSEQEGGDGELPLTSVIQSEQIL